ncbi:MAG: glutamine-hydrolyzing GMP synthase, partial [Gammaproteobacteria bacterium]|nr:glutamine-hydrolyzing GMP synthase [Gammaproteobacteria bacterium]
MIDTKTTNIISSQRSQDIHREKILILDFGSQYTQLIARRVREVGVYCEIHPFDFREESAKAFAPMGIILSGGPESVTADETLKAPDYVFEMSLPVLGICYGMQTMALQLGGKVEASDKREFGYARVTLANESQLLDGIQDETRGGERFLDVWMSHGDKVVALPDGFRQLAKTDSCEFAAMSDDARHFYGVQFHVEVNHTLQGEAILQRFLLDVCGCAGLWTPANIVENIISDVKKTVGNARVVLGLSGGVDSSVVAALMSRAIGDRLTCVFVDNGLLRKNEGDQVMDMFAKNMGLRVIRADAQ